MAQGKRVAYALHVGGPDQQYNSKQQPVWLGPMGRASQAHRHPSLRDYRVFVYAVTRCGALNYKHTTQIGS